MLVLVTLGLSSRRVIEPEWLSFEQGSVWSWEVFWTVVSGLLSTWIAGVKSSLRECWLEICRCFFASQGVIRTWVIVCMLCQRCEPSIYFFVVCVAKIGDFSGVNSPPMKRQVPCLSDRLVLVIRPGVSLKESLPHYDQLQDNHDWPMWQPNYSWHTSLFPICATCSLHDWQFPGFRRDHLPVPEFKFYHRSFPGFRRYHRPFPRFRRYHRPCPGSNDLSWPMVRTPLPRSAVDHSGLFILRVNVSWRHKSWN